MLSATAVIALFLATSHCATVQTRLSKKPTIKASTQPYDKAQEISPSVFLSTLVPFGSDSYFVALGGESCFLFGVRGDFTPVEVQSIQTFLTLPEIQKLVPTAYWKTVEWHVAQGTDSNALASGPACEDIMSGKKYEAPEPQKHVNMLLDLYFQKGLFASVDSERMIMYKAVSRLHYNAYAKSLQELSDAYFAPGSTIDIADLFLSESIDHNWLLSQFGTMSSSVEDRASLLRILKNNLAFEKFSKLAVDLFACLTKKEEKDAFRRTIADIIKYYQASGVNKAKVKTLITSIGMTVTQVQDIISGRKLKFESITAILPVFFFIPDCSYLYGTTGFPEYVFPIMTIEQKKQLIKAKPMKQLPPLFPSEKYARATPGLRLDLAQIANDLIIEDVIEGQDAQTFKKALFVVGKLEQPFLYDLILYVDQMTVWENKKLDILLTEPKLAEYVYKTIDVYIEWLNQPYRLFLFLLAKSYQKNNNKWAFDMTKFMRYAFGYSTGDGMPTLRKRMLFLFNEFGLKSVPKDLFTVSPDGLLGADVFCDALVRSTQNSDYSKKCDNPVKVTVDNHQHPFPVTLFLDPKSVRNVDLYFMAADLIEMVWGAYEIVDQYNNVILPDTELIDPKLLDGSVIVLKRPDVVDADFMACFEALGISLQS